MVKSFIQQCDYYFYTISSLKFLSISCNVWASSEVIPKVLQATKRIMLAHAAHSSNSSTCLSCHHHNLLSLIS
jgi:hypothetical protein